jgi:hypothetical protein
MTLSTNPATTAPTTTTASAPEISGWSSTSSIVIAVSMVAASLYGLLATDPYRDLPHETVVAALAQDACSILVAGALLVLARRRTAHAHLVRLGLLAYVAYSYTIYLTGLPMNRMFVVYVVLVSLAGAGFLDGLLRLRPCAWPRVARGLERGTGWMLLVVAVLFAGLWLAAVVPFALGGDAPSPEGPGGVAYPVFILDLVIVLPCIAAIGVMLLRGRPVAGPLAAVALVKIVTLFAVLWTGVLVAFVEDGQVTLAADAGPSLVLLLVSSVLAGRWLRALSPNPVNFVRPTVWVS